MQPKANICLGVYVSNAIFIINGNSKAPGISITANLSNLLLDLNVSKKLDIMLHIILL